MVAAIRVHAPGGPEVLKLEEIALPPPGRGEIRVRQTAIGVNYVDVHFRTGAFKAPQMPFVPGGEAAGTIVALGEGVTGFSIGERVAYAAFLGCYAAERNVDARMAVKLPDGISDEVAAAALVKGLTAELLLHRVHPVKPGDTILVHAAAGGVGQILTQWGRHLGATVIGTAGSADKAALAKGLGCDHVILYREEDVARRVAEITDGAKCQAVYDGVGEATFEGSLDSLRPLGVLASFGEVSGPVRTVDLGTLRAKGSLLVTRPSLFTSFLPNRLWLEEMAARLFAVIASGAVGIDITRRGRLAEAADMHRARESRETTGMLIMVP